MARGMVVGEAIVSQANTRAFEEGYERVFGGERRPVQRGRSVYRPGHPLANERGFVSVADLRLDETRALDAPVMAGRFYEGTVATDGTDIGSRQKHQAYMKQHGLAHESDFRECGAKARAERERFYRGEQDDKPYVEAVERSLYELEKRGR